MIGPLQERAIFMLYHECLYPDTPWTGGGASSDWGGYMRCTGAAQFRCDAVITHIENEV